MSTSVSRNILWLTISRVFSLLLLAVAYSALFRYLKPYGSGQYQFVLSYVLLFSTVVDFGVQQLITKKVSEDPKSTKTYFREFFSFEVLAAFLLYTLLLIIAYSRHFDPIIFKSIAIAGLGMVANALCYPFMAVMAAFQDIKKVALINFLNSLVNVTVIFTAIFTHRSIVFLSCIQLAFGVLDLILYRIFIKKHLPKPEVLKAIFSFNFKVIKNILKQGWPFALLVGFSAIYNRIDVIIISTLKGFVETGYYTAAYKIFDLLNFFPAAVSFTLFPYFASLMAKNDLKEVKFNLEKYLKLMILAAVPLAAGGAVLSARLISLIAGPGYEPASAVLAILIFAPAIQFIYIPVNSLIISQLTKKALIITGVNVVVNILGNLLLIPHYGIKSAAVMTVFSECLQGIFYFYFINKNITSFKFSNFFPLPIISAIVMAAVLWPIRTQNLLITLPIGTLVYLAMLVLTGFLKKQDLLLLRNLFSKAEIKPAPNT